MTKSNPLPIPGAEADPGDHRPAWLAVLIQFAVVPMLIVALCVGLVLIFRWMTHEQRSLGGYVAALRASPTEQGARGLLNYIEESKRWQGIFDMTQQLGARRAELLKEDPELGRKLLLVFDEAARRGDWKLRQYLALVLGFVGERDAVPALLAAAEAPAQNNQDGTSIAAMKALAMIGDERAVPVLLRLMQGRDRNARLTAAWALGSFSGSEVDRALEAGLGDESQFVRWNAAIALARRGRTDVASVLEQLAGPGYLDRHAPRATGEEKSSYRVTAVQLLGRLNDRSGDALIDRLARDDSDYRVRQAAIAVLKARQETKP
jgi:HEAT repeat protein